MEEEFSVNDMVEVSFPPCYGTIVEINGEYYTIEVTRDRFYIETIVDNLKKIKPERITDEQY